MRYLLFALTFSLATCAAILAAPAAEVLGKSTPQFEELVRAWLAGDDQNSLPGLAKLAAEGDTAARILLGRLDVLPGYNSNYLNGLDRIARKLLFKAPGGKFGKSWLAVLSSENELANAFSDFQNLKKRQNAAKKLHQLGETIAAQEAVLHSAFTGDELPESAFPSSVHYLFWTWNFFWQNNQTLRTTALTEALEELKKGSVQGILWLSTIPDEVGILPGLERQQKLAKFLAAPTPYLQATATKEELQLLDAWIKNFPLAEPIQNLCDRKCPNSKNNCARAGYGLLGTHPGVLQLGSPSEAVISNSRFKNTPRADMRIIALAQSANQTLGEFSKKSTRSVDACFSDLLELQ